MTRPSNTQMHEQPNSSDHTRHDLLAVAALADRDATGEEAARAQAQVDTCTECATLQVELVSLASATHTLPAVQRPRDFQLRPEDAQRLRPNRVRRLFGAFGTPRDGFSRPLALGLTTLGLAGLLLGFLPGTLSFGSAGSAAGGPEAGSAPQQEVQQSLGAAASAAPAAPAEDGAPAAAGDASAKPAAGEGFGSGYGTIAAPAPAPTGADTFNQRDESDGGPVAIAGERDSLTSLSEDSTGVSQLIVISGTLLIVGLGLFALRWTSRRFGG
jgi:hypothetical protein